MFGSTYGQSLAEKQARELIDAEISKEMSYEKNLKESTEFKEFLKQLAAKKHAQLVQESLSKSASDAAASAGRVSSAAAVYNALSKEAAAKHAAISSEYAAQMENIRHARDLIDRGVMPGSIRDSSITTNDVIQSAAEGYEKSMTDETYNLPEVQVKSDFGKYLLIGGGVLLAIYLLRGKKKNA